MKELLYTAHFPCIPPPPTLLLPEKILNPKASTLFYLPISMGPFPPSRALPCKVRNHFRSCVLSTHQITHIIQKAQNAPSIGVLPLLPLAKIQPLCF